MSQSHEQHPASAPNQPISQHYAQQNQGYPAQPNPAYPPSAYPVGQAAPVPANGGGVGGKWGGLSGPVKAATVVVGIILAVIFVAKILPALIVSMGLFAVLAVLFLPYWIPTIVAFARKHPSKGAIFVLNFFLGWTFVGWIVSLVWSLSNPASGGGTTVIVNTTVAQGAPQPYYAPPQSAPVASPSPQYQIGDVVNGHQFNGAAWVQLPPGGQVQSPASVSAIPTLPPPAP